MTFRLCIVAVTLAVIGFGASRLNRRLRVDRPSPLTLVEKYLDQHDKGTPTVPAAITCITAVARDAVVALVVAVDRYVDNHNEADEGVRLQLWQTMTSANDVVAEAFKVYPL